MHMPAFSASLRPESLPAQLSDPGQVDLYANCDGGQQAAAYTIRFLVNGREVSAVGKALALLLGACGIPVLDQALLLANLARRLPLPAQSLLARLASTRSLTPRGSSPPSSNRYRLQRAVTAALCQPGLLSNGGAPAPPAGRQPSAVACPASRAAARTFSGLQHPPLFVPLLCSCLLFPTHPRPAALRAAPPLNPALPRCARGAPTVLSAVALSGVACCACSFIALVALHALSAHHPCWAGWALVLTPRPPPSATVCCNLRSFCIQRCTERRQEEQRRRGARRCKAGWA